MLLLAADTSGKHGSIALAKCELEQCSIVEVVPLMGGTFSAQLVPQIAALLSKHAFSKRDLDGFAVVSGPGSFTGLRVGLAAIKGLAEILKKPIAAVSLLEIVAQRSGVQGEAVVALDAGRNEVYVGNYELSAEGMRFRAESLMSRAKFVEQNRGRRVTTPDHALAGDLRSAAIEVVESDPVSSADVAEFGWKKIRAGETISSEELEANYIRRSDAEIFSTRR